MHSKWMGLLEWEIVLWKSHHPLRPYRRLKLTYLLLPHLVLQFVVPIEKHPHHSHHRQQQAAGGQRVPNHHVLVGVENATGAVSNQHDN